MVDSELLINEVQKRPVLWDKTCYIYKNKNKKKAAWIEVCSVLSNNFNSEKESEQRILVQDIMSKWRSIRDNYVRNHKRLKAVSKSGAVAEKIWRYKYEEQLHFLKKILELRPTVSTSTEESQGTQDVKKCVWISSRPEDNENENENFIVTDLPSPTTSTKAIIKQELSENVSTEEDLINFMDAQKAKMDQPMLIEDEDLAFFMSLLPTVRSLSVDEKFAFRMETMKLLQDIKNRKDSLENFYITKSE